MKPAKKLNHIKTIEIVPTSPFHFNSTFYKPGHFPSSDTRWEPGKRWQTMLWRGKPLGLVIENVGDVEIPMIFLYIYSNGPLQHAFVSSIVQEIKYRYNLKLDLQNFYDTFYKDAQLSPIFLKFRGLRPMHSGSLYEYLIISIVLQNATVRRSVSMMQALFEKFGTPLIFDKKEFYCFWEPQVLAQASEQELRKLKVGYRAKSLIKVSEPFADGQIDEIALRKKTQKEQKDTLFSLYGIGPASVGYIMFDVFHHWDFLVHISPWEQKIYTKLFFKKDHHHEVVAADEMIKYFEKRFGRYKALAVHYIWEDLWWKRRNERIPWLEELIRL